MFRRTCSLCALAAALSLSAGPAGAAWNDWTISPLTGSLYDLTYSVGGQVQGTVFSASQPGPLDRINATGAAYLSASIERDYDSGLALSLKGQFEIYHDKLSGDNYGSKLLAKLYGSAQTGLGRIDVGMSDGAAYTLAVIGPSVNGEVSLDNPNATFFTDPATRHAFINLFALNSAVESSLNYAKISYTTPRLFGVQLASSFTPSEGKDVLPFLNNGPKLPDRQGSMWEGAINYNDSFGPLTLSASGGVTVGHDRRKTAGHAGLTDWAFGAQADWNVDEDWKLSLGGAFRQANTFTFAINDARMRGVTQSLHASAVASWKAFSLGGEFGNGTADGRALGDPLYGVHGYMVDAAYALNSNLQITGGWQMLRYTRTLGAFYNGAPRINMDAVFLHAALNI